MRNLDLLFNKCGKTEKAVIEEAEKILTISNVSPFERGKYLIDMLNILSARDIGPGKAAISKMTLERELVFSIFGQLYEFYKHNWAKADWKKSELVDFLKVYYGLQFYCKNTDMGNEWLRLLENKEENSGDSTH